MSESDPVFGLASSHSINRHHDVVPFGSLAGSHHVRLILAGSFYFPFTVRRGRRKGLAQPW